jgi:crotonobetaine/carnitine-CoA ligase
MSAMNRLNLSDIHNRTLVHALRLQAERAGDQVFLRRDEERVSFEEAERRSNALAHGLKSLGVRRGDRVALFMKSGIEIVLFALAINKLGAVWTPINTDYKGIWLEEILNACKVRVIVTDRAMIGRLAEVIDRVRHEHVVLDDSRGTGTSAPSLAAPPPMRLPAVIPAGALFEFPATGHDLGAIGYGDTAAILWTSGTTGKSKGVMQPHNIWIVSAESYETSYQSRTGDVVYSIMPLYNSGGWGTNVFRALVEGITCAFDPEFSVSRFWERIRYYGATQTFTLGAMHMFLWQAPPRADDADNPLRAATMVPMPESLIDPFRERFGIELISQRFGQSEANPVLCRLSGRGRRWKPNELGEPYPGGLAVELRDEDGHEVAAGEIGEFCVKPSRPFQLFNGYFDNEEATRREFIGEWYRMGDLGVRDRDGSYYFVDRKRDAVRYKGRNISSLEVENAVRGHPAVADVAAFGVVSKELSTESELKINVVLKPGASLTAEELCRYINDSAPYYFVPRFVEFVAALPYTPTNKVQKFLLRQRGLTESTWDLAESNFIVRR